MKGADIIQSRHALSFIATCTLALSSLPCSGEAFILVLKDRSDRQYGREKQQDAHCELALSSANEYKIVRAGDSRGTVSRW